MFTGSSQYSSTFTPGAPTIGASPVPTGQGPTFTPAVNHGWDSPSLPVQLPPDARFAAPTVGASPVPTGSSVQTPKPAKATSKAVVASNRETLGKRTAQQAWSAALKRRSVDADVLPATFPKGPIPGSSVELKHAISEFSRNGHTNGLGGNFTVSMLLATTKKGPGRRSSEAGL